MIREAQIALLLEEEEKRQRQKKKEPEWVGEFHRRQISVEFSCGHLRPPFFSGRSSPGSSRSLSTNSGSPPAFSPTAVVPVPSNCTCRTTTPSLRVFTCERLPSMR